jgi:hypothetical protein
MLSLCFEYRIPDLCLPAIAARPTLAMGCACSCSNGPARLRLNSCRREQAQMKQHSQHPTCLQLRTINPSIHRQNHHFPPLPITSLKISCPSYNFTASLTFASGAGLAASSVVGHPMHQLHQYPLGWHSSVAESSLGCGGGGF